MNPPPVTTSELPMRKIPGDYGLPIIGPIKDRLDYFYNQGTTEFFKSRIEKYQSTVFRVNMAPGPFISSDTRVIVLLDGASFPILYDNEKIDKTDILYGTYMPSLKLTGGYRVLAYQDPTEPSHAKIKRFLFNLIASRHQFIIPEFHGTFGELFHNIEKGMTDNKKVDFNTLSDQSGFKFLVRALLGKNPVDKLGSSSTTSVMTKWLFFLLSPLMALGLPKYLEDLLLHTFPLPSFLVKSDYDRLYRFFYETATDALDSAEKLGISREEACHNLIFVFVFNAWGGMKILFPSIMKWVGQAGEKLHRDLAKEIREAVKTGNGITLSSIENMPLMKSVVYEVLRIEPPVPDQYGRAKEDLVIRSHDHEFEVKKGEVLFGHQPFATRDSRIFEKGEEFVGDRFVGEGRELVKHVLWSNGREIDNTSVNNKQCGGKDFVVLMARLFVVELFLRYDTFGVEASTVLLGPSVKVTSLTKASS